MGAMITVKFDTGKVDEEAVAVLANALKPLVEEVIKDSDVFVYCEGVSLTVGAELIEVFVQVNELKIADVELVLNETADKLKKWKAESSYNFPINLNLIPVKWYSITDI